MTSDLTLLRAAHAAVLDHGVADAMAGVAATVDPANVMSAVPAVRAHVAAVVGKYGHAAYALAVEHYRAVRADAGIRGKFTMPPPVLPAVAKVDSTVGWAIKPLFGGRPDAVRAQRDLTLGAQWLVLNTARSAVLDAVYADPKAQGWVRVPETAPCAYCASQAARGVTPRSGRPAVFHAHTSCRCIASPSFPPH